jgi:hypothetical protein
VCILGPGGVSPETPEGRHVTPGNRTKAILGGGALVVAGFAGGAALAATGSASASTDAGTRAVTEGPGQAADRPDPGRSVRPDEHLLTGTTAAKVKAAALATYPGATVQRVETDSDGVYEAHVVTSAGDQVIVQVGKDFTVTGTQTGGGRGGHGGPGRHGDRDGDGPGAPTEG